MKKSVKIALAISLYILAFAFITVGYAAISSNIKIDGTLESEASEYKGVYISEVRYISGSNASNNSFEIHLPTNLRTSAKVSRANSSVTYEITVHNNTDVTYWYLGIDYLKDYGYNSEIGKGNGITITTKDNNTTSSNAFDHEDWVPPQTYRTFYVTYKFGSNVIGNDIFTLVNFKFGLHMDSVGDEFLKILNDKTSRYGYYYLASAFEEQYAETGKTYLGNIGDDEEVFTNLFGPDIHIDIDGVPTPVTIIVSHRNVDGSESNGDKGAGNGCEYTVYITTDPLDGGQPTVYAVSYTCDSNGVWRQIGELYEGKCNLADYDNQGNDGFDVMSWRAVNKRYDVMDGVYYTLGDPNAHDTGMLTRLEDIMSVKDVNFGNTVNNNARPKLFEPVCKILYSYANVGGKWVESANTSNMYNPGYDILENAFNEMRPYLQINNGGQEVKLKDNLQLSRAELIRIIEKLDRAYEYYKSVN